MKCAAEQASIAAMEQSQIRGKERVEAFRQSYGQQSQYPAAPHESYGRSAERSCPSVLRPQTSHSAGQQGYFSNQQTDCTLQRSQGCEDNPARQSYSQAQSPISPYQSSGQSYASQQPNTRSYSGAHEPDVGIREPPSSHRDPYSRAHDAYPIARDPCPDSREPSYETRKPNPGSRIQRRGKR